MDHVLRYCPTSREIWSSLGIPNSSAAFYLSSFSDRVSLNATNKLIVDLQDRSMKFAITCWWIWRWRNNIAFGRPNENPTHPIDLLRQQFEASKNAFDKFSLFVPKPGSIRNEIFIRWHPPPHGWCLLNTDGASKGNPGPAGCGGVFRDETGNFISAYMFSGGVCTSMRAKMLALVAGLERAKELHIDKLIVHMDNVTCVKMVLEDQLLSNSLRHLVHRSKELIHEPGWKVKLLHVFREANKASDWLANQGVLSSTSIIHIDDPPDDLRSILREDIMGVTTSRLVP